MADRPTPPPPGMSPAGGKTLSPAVLKRVLGYMLKLYWAPFLLVIACILVSAVATVRATLFMRTLVDGYILPMAASGSTDFSNLASDLASLACLLAVGVVASYGYNRIMVSVSQGTMRRLRTEVFENMESLPIGYFDTHQHGDIMSVYTNDTDTLRQFFGQTIPQFVNSLVTLVVTFVSMCMLSLPLTAISVAMVVIMLIVTGRIAQASGGYFVAQQKDLGSVNGYIEEMMDGQKVVKVFCHEEESREGFHAINEQLRTSAFKANFYGSLVMPVNANIGNLSYVLIAVAGAALAINGLTGLTLGALVSFLSLNRNFSQPITQISQQVAYITTAMAGAARIFALMDEHPEEDRGTVELVNARVRNDGSVEPCGQRTGVRAWKVPTDDGPRYRLLEGGIAMDGVDFGYTPDKPVLHGITIEAAPGQKIAFVGSTGAGKTTITNLVNRFYDIDDGKITYDGIDINAIKKGDLRRSLGIVLQDTRLFTGTVMDNIRYGRLDATDEECVEAARLANADGFIRRLPQGYQTVITGDGASLSQGQCQLLAIARAAVADPPALILDEATSSIDTRTEALVQEGMDKLMAGRTTFVIAHRLSTVRNADCIMVIEQGRIIERGNHERLMAKRGRYWQLYTGGNVAE